MIKIAKLSLVLSVLAVLIGCSDNPNYETFLIFEDNGYMPLWYPTGEKIIFIQYSNRISSITPDGEDLTILFSGDEMDPPVYSFSIYSISDDGYILFEKDNIYYFKPGEEPVKTDIVGRYSTVYGALSGTYNIAYTYDDDEKTDEWSIYISDINGSPPKRLIGEGRFYHLDWSPDGSKLVYSKMVSSYPEPQEYAICVYDLGSEEERVIYSSEFELRCPRFSPDGSYIAFAKSGKHSQKVVWLISSEGGEPWQVTEYPHDPYHETPGTYYLSWSPDGKWIVYDMGTEGELWKVRVFD